MAVAGEVAVSSRNSIVLRSSFLRACNWLTVDLSLSAVHLCMRSATLTIIAPGKGGAGMYSVHPRGKTCRVKHNWLRSADYTSSNNTISYLCELKTQYPKGSSFLSILDKSQINHSLVSGNIKKAAQTTF